MTTRFKPIHKADGTPYWMIALYGALFVLALYVVLSSNVSCLLSGRDGVFWTAVFQSQAARQPFSQLGVSPLEGNFDAYMAFREYFLPETLALLFSRPAGAPFTYAIYGMELFLSSFALARSVGFGRTVASVAAAFVPVVALPTSFSSAYWLWSIYNLYPHYAQMTSSGIAIIACFWALDEGRTKALALSLTALALVILAFLSNAITLVIAVPCIAVYAGASLFLRKQGTALRARIGLAAACIAVPAALGMFHYLIAALHYTAYFFFSPEFMQDRTSLDFASIFYHAGFLGRFLVVFGFMGAIFCALTRTGKLRTFAWAHVIVTLIFIPASFLLVEFASNYHGPSPLYLEFAQWPIIIIFNVFGASAVWRLAVTALQQVGMWPSYTAIRTIPIHLALAAAPLFLVGWNSWALAAGHDNHCARDEGFLPVRPNAITTYLKDAIATRVGAPFRGLVATFAGFDGKPSVDWFMLAQGDWSRSVAIGNDMRLSDLWMEGIPTLMQYSPLITPPYYLMVSEFLSRPSDKQLRNILILTRPNQRMLALWGARFLITDFDPGFGKFELTLPVPGLEPLRLYELDDPNLGNYSPTAIRPADNFHSALAAMHEPEFDGRKVLVTDYRLNGPLVAASDVKLVFQKTGFTLHASSAGSSVLVLPVQYSRCWSVAGRGNPILFRANIMQLGVMFSGDLDANLVFRFGPILASSCRSQDIADMERLDIGDARAR